MCGIFGYIGYIDKNLAKKCTNTLAHRGPDGFGLHHTDNFCFGHRRLAILDLSEKGKQPMSYANDRYWITYNGEIYNFLEIKNELTKKGYKFFSETDTEVILAAFTEWKEKCLKKFNGMWAFAIWDNVNKKLFLSRDRFGKKPLFFSQIENNFIFASEMKAITPLLKNIEPNLKLIKGKMFAYEHTEECLIKNIKRFPAGHFGYYKNEKLHIKKYWNTLDHLIKIPKSYEDQLAMFQELFLDACKIRMRSDVPIGTALSGGLDSSAVISSLAHIGKRGGERLSANWQNAFIASFPGSILDEVKYAKKVTDNIGINPHIIQINPEKYIKKLNNFFYLFEEIYNTSPIPFIVTYEAMRKNKIIVTLDGHGADELFGGYGFDILNAFDNSKWHSIKSLEMLSAYYGIAINNSGQFRKLPPKSIYAIKSLIKKILGKSSNQLTSGNVSHKNWDSLDCLNKILYNSTHETTLPTLLRNYDRYSMINGVEIRMPFMDHRIVSFAFSLPWTSKIKNGFTKSIIRDSLSDFMPKKIAYRKTKIGFNSPIIDWIKGPLKPFLFDIVNSSSFLNSNYIDSKTIKGKIENTIKDPNATFTMGMDIWKSLSPYLWEQSFLKKVTSKL